MQLLTQDRNFQFCCFKILFYNNILFYVTIERNLFLFPVRFKTNQNDFPIIIWNTGGTKKCYSFGNRKVSRNIEPYCLNGGSTICVLETCVMKKKERHPWK